MLVDSGIIRFSSTTGRWLSDALSDGRIEVLGISPEVAVRAIDVGRAIRQDPADHLVGATALVLNAPLVTRDSAFERMPGLQVIW